MTSFGRDAFRKRLSSAPLVCDGAMGTSLYGKGVMVNRCFDELNLSNREFVGSVHRDYLGVGVDVLETNTYGANRFKLEPHGFKDRVREINESGAAVARDAIGEKNGPVLVAGSIGPLGKPIAPIGTISEEEALASFGEQGEGLIAGAVDFVILETFSDLRELGLAIRALREVAPDLPIVAQMTYGDDGSTPLGAKPERVARKLSELDIDAIGANCSVGPELMLRVVERLATATKLPISVQPNAGLPELVEGRVIYLSSPEYMGHYAKRFLKAGATILGGCCGTTPDHIGAMVGVVRALGPARTQIEVAPAEERVEREPVPREKKSRLARSLGRKFVVSVEMDPPKGADPGLFLEKAQWLKENEVDYINVGDGPRASARMSALSFAVLSRAACRLGDDPSLSMPRPEPHRHPVGSARGAVTRLAQHPRGNRRSPQARRLPICHRGLRRRLRGPHEDPRTVGIVVSIFRGILSVLRYRSTSVSGSTLERPTSTPRFRSSRTKWKRARNIA